MWPSDPGRAGDTVNTFIMLSITVYLGIVAAHAQGALDVSRAFGELWRANGFCISFPGTVANSHLLCLYADTAMAALFLWLGSRGGKDQDQPHNYGAGTQAVRDNIFPVLAHGLGHGFLHFLSEAAGPQGLAALTSKALLRVAAERAGTTPNVVAATLITGAAIFFFAFFRNLARNQPRWLVLLQSMLHPFVLVLFVPPLFFFTYVNTVLFVNIIGSELCRPRVDKGYIYFLYSTVVGLPVLGATWLEPLLCDWFLVRVGGHVWFDLTISLSVLAFWCIMERNGNVTDNAYRRKAQ